MPEPMDMDDMPEVEDYDSPYPVDDRHMLDSIYRMSITNGEAMADMYGAYRTIKIIVSILFSALAATLFAGLVLIMAGVL